MKKYKILANRANYGNKRKISDISYLIIHYTANDGDHDTNNALYFKNNVVEASAHEFVDDDSYTISVPANYVAWAVGGAKYSDCNTTGGGKMYGKITNDNSYSIEMCDTNPNGKIIATELTMENTAKRARAIMAKYNIPLSRVYRHFDVNGKHCPSYFMDDEAWNNFKNRLKKGKKPITAVSSQSSIPHIIWLQRKLNEKVDAKIPDNGQWGSKTERGIVKAYKKYFPNNFEKLNENKQKGKVAGIGLIRKLSKIGN